MRLFFFSSTRITARPPEMLTCHRLALCLLVAALAPGALARAPNILFIVCDDLGHNDVSFFGSPQIPTPNIDALFSGGATLASYRAQPVCSPTRASILSGRHVIHTGIFMPFDSGVTNEALDPAYTLLPRYLKRAANYSTHLVGKYHIGVFSPPPLSLLPLLFFPFLSLSSLSLLPLPSHFFPSLSPSPPSLSSLSLFLSSFLHIGANTKNATPVGRGFDSAYGYWSGAEDYTSHTVTAAKRQVYDLQEDLAADVSVNGTFSTPIFAARAAALIAAQGAAGPSAPPLFLYLAFQNVHWPLEAPPDFVARFANATGGNHGRQMVCAMAAFLDEAVGNVTRALTAAGLDDDTIIVILSDNGGPTHGNEGTWSNNYPLRGGKNTLWEGGTRVLAAVKGPGIAPGTTVQAPIHATDWLPSLVSMATGGADFRSFAPPGEPPYEDGDGVDVWASILGGPPQRDWLLLEAHAPAQPQIHGNGLVEWRGPLGVLKYLQVGPEAPAEEDGWWPPDGQDPAATPYLLRCSWQGGGPRAGAAANPSLCTTAPCLFNLTADPCEYHDIAAQQPAIVAAMAARLAGYRIAPPLVGKGCMPHIIDIAGTHGPALQFLPCDVPTPTPAPAPGQQPERS